MTSSINPEQPVKDSDKVFNINFQQLPKQNKTSKNADINLPHQGSFGSLFTT